MDGTELAGLVRRDLVEAAAKVTVAAIGKRDAARDALKRAEAAILAAERASAEVAGDPLTLAAAERDARDALTFARRVLDLAEMAATHAATAQAAAEGEAYRPIHAKGVDLRLAAVRRADAARAELAAAETDFREGTDLVFDARAHRCVVTSGIDVSKIATSVTSERAEAALWGI